MMNTQETDFNCYSSIQTVGKMQTAPRVQIITTFQLNLKLRTEKLKPLQYGLYLICREDDTVNEACPVINRRFTML